MPVLETTRLLIRPFATDDLSDVHRLLDVELKAEDLETDVYATIDQRREWLQWTVLNYRQLALLRQPPYGDRAIVLKTGGVLIGACGFVPCLAPFGKLPGFGSSQRPEAPTPYSTEFGLFYAVSPGHQRHGYASEAAGALVEHAFRRLHLRRVVAMTGHNNPGSIGVMRHLGMRLTRNPEPEPPWLQVVGVLENPNPE
ncbi:MAG TPA: GNAT family N-acetyltransferase [bacterium]